MAYPLNLGDIVSFTIEGRSFGQQVMSVFHFEAVGGVTAPDGAAALSGALAFLNDPNELVVKWTECVGTDVNSLTTRIQKIAPTRFRYIAQAPTSVVGQGGTAAVAGNLSAAITKRAEEATRHGLGTLHMPGVPSGFITDGAINGLGIDAYGALAAEMTQEVPTGVGGMILTPVIFNRTAPLASARVVSASPQFTLRTMHRRTVGVGA